MKAVHEASGDLNSLLVEDIQGNRLIQAFALKSREKRFDEIGKVLEKRSLEAMYRWSLQGPETTFCHLLAYWQSLVWELICCKLNLLLLPANSLLSSYANMFYEPVRQLVSINNLLLQEKHQVSCF